MRDFYTRSILSVVSLLALSGVMYGYEFFEGFTNGSEDAGERVSLSSSNSMNQIDGQVLNLLETQAELILQAEQYAVLYPENSYFSEIAEKLEYHLVFAKAVYELSDQDFPVITESRESPSLEANVSEQILREQRSVQSFQRDVQVLEDTYSMLMNTASQPTQRVAETFQIIVLE